ncbi:MAG: hypothetical protein B7733_20720 [Myxococcales bacterium FL481]|nr:MAG: hypothetical protein B7733_20720 [Myxococcales bacterium FL481]
MIRLTRHEVYCLLGLYHGMPIPQPLRRLGETWNPDDPRHQAIRVLVLRNPTVQAAHRGAWPTDFLLPLSLMPR